MFTTAILTSWTACPQSRLYQDVVARGDRRSIRLLTKVARQWDHTLAPDWMSHVVPRRLQPGPFDAAEYRPVVTGLPLDVLGATLEQLTWLRAQPGVRASLRAVAFLEDFETVVQRELESQLGITPSLAQAPPPRPRQPRSRSIGVAPTSLLSA